MPFTTKDIIDRLNSLGYSIKPNDSYSLGFLTGKIENEVKNFCNIDEIPEELKYTLIDAVCGEFLCEKKVNTNFALNKINISDVLIKSISEGDTNVNYYVEGNQTPEQKLDGLIDFWRDKYKKDLAHYRRLAW